MIPRPTSVAPNAFKPKKEPVRHQYECCIKTVEPTVTFFHVVNITHKQFHHLFGINIFQCSKCHKTFCRGSVNHPLMQSNEYYIKQNQFYIDEEIRINKELGY